MQSGMWKDNRKGGLYILHLPSREHELTKMSEKDADKLEATGLLLFFQHRTRRSLVLFQEAE